ncbi:MAG: helix-turn-helix transcriptional regulator [Syntrophaceae bacterium]|nr:helix-turn-helix transcriptional regulator [Syntrophaceae bacterium]
MVSDEIKHEVRKLHIGKKIRELRKRAGLILQDLSDRTGLSKPLLSQIEKEVVSPPIATLLKISKALNVDIGFFFQDSSHEEKVVFVRRDESRAIDSRSFGREEGGYYYEALAYKKSKKYMEPFLVEFKRKRVEKLSFLSHDGEEFIYLLEGTLEFRTENGRYILQPGDSLYFESSIPHAYRSLERRNAKALTVVYPAR